MDTIGQYIKEKYEHLPSDVRDAILSIDVDKAIQNIGARHNLHVDKIGALDDETRLVMLGVVHPKDFIRNLYDRLGSDDKEAVRQIAHEVNEQVFQKIRESLKSIHAVENEKPSEPEPVKKEIVIPTEKALETKEEMVEKIEHPEKEEKDIVKEKLQKMNVMPKEESEYEIKTNGRNKEKWSADPYREPVA